MVGAIWMVSCRFHWNIQRVCVCARDCCRLTNPSECGMGQQAFECSPNVFNHINCTEAGEICPTLCVLKVAMYN